MNKYTTGKTYLILVSVRARRYPASLTIPAVTKLCISFYFVECNVDTHVDREAVSTVRKKPMLSIKLTDNSATKSGISLTHPYAEREEDKVCV